MRRVAVFALTVGLLVAVTRAQQPAAAAREAAYRANNIGVAYLEQYNFASATASFRDALRGDSNLAIARLNLGIALFYGGEAKAARTELEAARTALPGRAEPDYVLGLLARSEDRTEDAIAAFTRVRAIDPSDPGAATNLGQLYLQQREYGKAVDVLRAAAAAEPYNATAAYGLATALTRSNDPGARAAMDRFQTLRASGYAITYSQAYLEQGRYGEAVASTGAEADLVDTATPEVGFSDVSATVFPSEAGRRPALSERRESKGAVTLADLDGDGDLDLVDGGGSSLRVFRNDNGRFVDATAAWFGTTAVPPAIGAIAGDYDNDGRADLLVLRASGLTLYKQTAQGRFEDATAAAKLAAIQSRPAGRTAAWVDADHDGDLDLLVSFTGPAAPDASAHNALLRNNGDGTFTDITTQAGIAVAHALAAVVPTDFDNRRDVDLLMAGPGGAPLLFRNMRDGTFKDVAADAGLRVSAGAGATAAGDVNKDGYPDFFFANPSGPGTLALSDGRAGFKSAPLPQTVNAVAAQFVDYDADGLLDLLIVTSSGPKMLRNVGSGWTDVTGRVFPGALASAAPADDAAGLATGDIDGDGLTDIVYRAGDGVHVWRNTRSTAAHTVHVQLTARVSNRSADGAKVDMRAGSLRQRLETFSATPAPAPADVIFGLGQRAGADVIRVLWPSGILQAELPEPPTATITGTRKIEELDRKPSSCPFLFTWNGSRFEFITDFLGGGEMGYLEDPPGQRNTPDPVEYVRVTGDQLKPRDGKYEIRVTNELEESMFLDRVQLIAVAHPGDVEVWPNAGLRSTPEPFRLITTRGARPPIAAIDDRGRDVLAAVSNLDRRFVDGFASDRVRGYAKQHTLTLTLPPAGPGGRRMLLLTGWTDYAFSMDNYAASQSGMKMMLPALQIEDGHGGWRTVIDDIGFPAGRPQTVTVDLTGKVPSAQARVRIVTSMKIYWDRILVDTSDARVETKMTRLDPSSAALSWRGFSKEGSPDGREPFGYDYETVSSESPWKQFPGRYTREGDVRELLAATDDRFVIARDGDQIALTFDAASLPPLPAGWTRTFLFVGDGFSKEMDLHSASPDELAPIPFHGMRHYPFAPSERPPLTAAQQSDLERYHTRIVARPLPPLETARRQ